MVHDFARLASYVRFYLTVRTQIGAAWENLERIHGLVKEALSPFAEPLLPVESRALAIALGPSTPFRGHFAELWIPEDEASLAGLTDLYEVVGRFSFQGEGNQNLARIQAMVSGARNEIVAQRALLDDLRRLPAEAKSSAERLERREAIRAEGARAEKIAAFEPLAEAVLMRARQTYEATCAVPLPDLSSAETAAEEYKRYATKVDQVYQTCLPFLRKAIGALYSFVECEPSASWPDALPIIKEMPSELCTVPPADSPELSQAQKSLSSLEEEEGLLGRAREEIAARSARLAGELGAAQMKEKELEVELVTTAAVIDYLAAIEQAEGGRRAVAELERQRTERLFASGEVNQRYRKTEATIKLLEEELKTRTEERAALTARLEEGRKAEPVLFGKDEWRRKVAELEAESEALRAAYAQRFGLLNQLRVELSAVSVEVQTEQAQMSLVERQTADTQAKLGLLEKAIREMGAALGASRPARPVPLAEGEETRRLLLKDKGEIGQHIERLQGELHRQKEESVRVLSRLKQIGVERQQMQAMLHNAKVAATEGREAALRQLSVQRRLAVERHVGEVLGTLEKSLSLIAPVFIEPAREVMLKACEPRDVGRPIGESLVQLSLVVDKIHQEIDAELLAQDAMLGQIQREFCDIALPACRAAWE